MHRMVRWIARGKSSRRRTRSKLKPQRGEKQVADPAEIAVHLTRLVPQDESEEGETCMHIKCGEDTREPCLPEIVFIPAHKECYEMRAGGGDGGVAKI